MQTLLTEGFRLGSKSKDPGANQQPTLPLLSSPVRASRTHSVDTDAGFVVVWGNVTLSELQLFRSGALKKRISALPYLRTFVFS